MYYSQAYIVLLSSMKQPHVAATQKRNLSQEGRMQLGIYGKVWKPIPLISHTHHPPEPHATRWWLSLVEELETDL